MLIVRPIGPGAGRYYATSPRPGRWVGGGAAALGLSGAVDLGELAEVLAGRHPLGPGPLGDPRHPRRRAGWDLTFAAPKGVSLVAELTAEAGVAAAHRAAVDEALGFAGRHACWAQSANRLVNAGSGMLAARFEHDRSAAGDPHLHTHVLLVNALRSEDGMWSAVTSSPLWRSERELSTIYRLGLRHHMAQAGLHPAWSLGAEGSADLAGIPPAAITASSRRRTQMAAHRAAGRDATGASAARAVTRGRGGEPAPEGWRAAVAAAGLDRERADALLGAGTPPREPELDAGSVSAALAEKASSFTVRDVIRAIGATSPTGMAAPTAEAFADRFCTAAIVVGPGRWTTAQAQAADRDVVELMARRPHDALGLVAPRRLEAAAADPNLDGAGRAGIRRLLGGGRAVDVVAGAAGHDRLDVQAALIDGARRAWQASGYQVAVAGGGRRWEALAAVPDERRVAAPVQILVVDRADRLSPPQLLSVLRRAASEATKVVLVEGGTLPLRPGRLSALPTLHHAPVMTAGGTAVVSSGRDAVAHLLGLWQRAAPTQRPLLVGAGPPEVALLNAAARGRLVGEGGIGGQAMHAGGRVWQAGDRVLALRANRAARVPAGSRGTVGDVAGDGRSMTVTWDKALPDTHLERGRAGFVGPGWATTPALAATAGGPVLVLGAPSRALPRHRVAGATVVAPATPRRPLRHNLLDAAVIEAGVAGSTLAGTEPAAAARADLAGEHRGLGARLAAALPPDPGPGRHHLDEERRWRAGSGRSADPAHDHRAAGLDHAGELRRRWVDSHADALARWEALGQAVEDRQDARAHALDVSPEDPRRRALGPMPDDPARQAEWAWSRHGAAVEVDRCPSPNRDHDWGLGLG